MNLHDILSLGFRYRITIEWDEVPADRLEAALGDLVCHDPAGGDADYLYLDLDYEVRVLYFKRKRVAQRVRRRLGVAAPVETLSRGSR